MRAYFDIGNHVKYAPPQQWIRTLGKLIAKCHVKDFKLNADGHDGNFCEMRDGSINWPAVRQALEDDRLSRLAEHRGQPPSAGRTEQAARPDYRREMTKCALKT